MQGAMSGAGRLLELSELLSILETEKILSVDQVQLLLKRQRSQQEVKLHPIEYIAAQKFSDPRHLGRVLDLEALTQWLAEYAELDYYYIDPLKVDVEQVVPAMSHAYASRHQILCVEVQADYVVIATAQPFKSDWVENLRHVLRKEIRRVVANPADIRRYGVEFYKLARSVSGASRSEGVQDTRTGNFEQMLELGNMQAPDANDQHIVNIVDWLLQYAFEQRASDIHIEPRRDKGRLRFRIDGVLHNVYEMPSQVVTAVNARIKILGRMNVAEKRLPQDGRLKTKSPEGNEVELRLSTLPTAFGEKMVMRIFDPDVLMKSFVELGFGEDESRRWQQMTSQPNGIVLVTGPTGSGKTTTLYTTLKELATDEVNLCTIEDPIEMVEPAFNQMQVRHNINLDFASGVRALLRQDPDIIMIGEIRDLETAEMAVQAALTGHLVLSTLHTNDAPSAITRMLELGVPGYLIKATVLGVMAQRLVRTLCPHCKGTGKIDTSSWQALVKPWKLQQPEQVRTPEGCLECRETGYQGRAGVYEVMLMSEQLKELIGPDMDLVKIRRQAMKEGMKTLRLAGAQKIAAGQTTLEEVLRVTPL